MELRKYAAIVAKWWWLLLLSTLLSSTTAYYVSQAQPRIYRASAMLLVSQAQDGRGFDYSSLLMSERLARTYAELIRKPPVLGATIEQLDLPMTPLTLASIIDVRVVRDTQLLELSVEHENPQLARDIANGIAESFIALNLSERQGRATTSRAVLQGQLSDLEREIGETTVALERLKGLPEPPELEVNRLQTLLSQQQMTYSQLLRSEIDLALAEARTTDSIQLAVPAELPIFPIRPNVFQNTVLATMVGLMLALGTVFLIEYLDDTVKSEEDVRQVADLATLAVIFRMPGQKGAGPRRLDETMRKSGMAEAYRLLRANIDFAWAGSPGQVVLVTSASPREGKTTTAVNLAQVMAQDGRRAILVDADLRRPSLHTVFGLERDRGLTNLLADPQKRAADNLHKVTQNLWVLPCGPMPPNPSELLGSTRFGEVLAELRDEADVVLLDAPPALGVVDPAVIAMKVDGIILVVEAGRTRLEALGRTVETLGKSPARLLGVVLNKVSESAARHYYYNYYDYYRKGYHGERSDNGPVKDAGVKSKQ